MTNSLTLATVHGGGIPAPLTILLAVAAVGYVLWSRMKGRPLQVKRLLVLPVVLIVIGITGLTGSSAHHLTPKDIAFLVVSVVISVILGAARGASIELYPQQGELWQRYRPNTVALWIALIATKLVITGIAGAAGASAGGGTNTLLLSLGVSLLAEAAIVGPRALSSGLPFATDHKEIDGDRSGTARSRPPLTQRLLDVAAPQDRSTSPLDVGTRVSESPRNGSEQADTGQWRSPSLSDGVNWLRRQIDQPAQTSWGQRVPSPRRSDDVRDNHHDHHHHNHHGLTGRS
jgi:hypothetical protein